MKFFMQLGTHRLLKTVGWFHYFCSGSVVKAISSTNASVSVLSFPFLLFLRLSTQSCTISNSLELLNRWTYCWKTCANS